MAFPTIPTGGRILATTQANTTATRTFPAFSGLTFSAGDLLVAICGAYQTSTGTNAAFSGWSQSFGEVHDSASSSTVAIGVATKIATGSETGSLTVTQAGTITGSAGMILFSIPAGTFDPSTPPEFSSRLSSTNSAADPGPLSPSWGAADTLFVEIGAVGETGTGGAFTGITGGSTSYTDFVETGISNDAVGGMEVGVAFRQVNTGTESPDAMNSDTSNMRWGAVLMGIAPVPPASAPPVADAGTDQTVNFGDPVTLDGTGSTDDVAITDWLWEQLGAEADITVVGSSQSSSTDSFSSSKSTAVIAGNTTDDVTILILEMGATIPTPTWPSGFAQKGSIISVTGGGTQQYAVAWKRHTGTDAGTYSVSWSGTQWNLLMAITLRNVTPTGDPFVDVQTSNNTTGTAVANINVTTTGKTGLVFVGIGDSNNGPMDWTPPTGPAAFAELLDNDYDSLAFLMDSGSGTRTISGATMSVSQAHGQMVMALAPAPGDETVTLSGETTDTATFTAPSTPAVLTFQLTVTDGDAQSDTDTVDITVEESGDFTGTASIGLGFSVTPVPLANFTGTATIGLTAAIAASAGNPGLVAGVSTDGRYLVDDVGNGVAPQFDTIWPMVQQAGNTARNGGSATWDQDIDFWVSTRASQGWNALKYTMFGQAINGAPNNDSRTWDTIFPFGASGSGTSGASPSAGFIEAYWQRVDYILDACAEAGLTSFIHVLYSDDVDSGVMSGKSSTEYGNLGTFLGNRYQDKPGIVWVIGGDYFDTSITQIEALRTALRATGDTHLWTVQNWANESSNEWTTSRQDDGGATQTLGTDIADIDACYTYEATYSAAQAAYTDTPAIPAIWYDGYYDQDSGDQLTIRRFNAWSLTYGAPGVQYGSEDLWSQPSGWRTSVGSPNTVVAQIVALREAFTSYARWTDLVPDFSSTFITAGRGSGNTFVTGGITSDGELAIIYLPVASSAITVDTAQMVAGYTATWVDPTNGATTAGTPGTSFSKGNNAAGSTDWLLVLAAPTAGDFTGTSTISETVSITATGVLGKTASVTITETVNRTATGAGTGAATRSETVGVTSTGTVGKNATATITETVAITSAGVLGKVGTATITETVGITAAGAGTGSVARTETVAITATGVVGISASASITETVSIVGSGGGTVGGSAIITETVGVTATGVVARSASTTLTETVGVSPTGVVGTSAGAALAETVAVTSDASLGVGRSSTLTETVSVTSTGAVTSGTSVTLTETVAITASGRVGTVAAATIPVTVAISPVGVVARSAGASLTETVAIEADGVAQAIGTGSCEITETTTVTAVGTMAAARSAALSETVAISPAGQVVAASGASLSATVGITAAGQVTSGTSVTITENVAVTAAGGVTGGTGATVGENVTIVASGVVALSGTASLDLGFTITIDTHGGSGPPITVTDPRAVLVPNRHSATLVDNPHAVVVVANPHGGQIVVDSYVAGDTAPPFTCILLDGNERFDPTAASEVRVKIWQDNTLLVDRVATTLSADGTVTCNWAPGETDEPGPILARVVVTSAGDDATFPPRGYMTAHISPASP